MSHFSKIKTNIANLEILKKTLKDFGFIYKYKNSSISYIENCNQLEYLQVFDNKINNFPIFEFIWDGYQYNLVSDFALWNLSMSVENFLEKLNQRYAYNIISSQSLINGFNQTDYIVMNDGSIKITMHKWNS